MFITIFINFLNYPSVPNRNVSFFTRDKLIDIINAIFCFKAVLKTATTISTYDLTAQFHIIQRQNILFL